VPPRTALPPFPGLVRLGCSTGRAGSSLNCGVSQYRCKKHLLIFHCLSLHTTRVCFTGQKRGFEENSSREVLLLATQPLLKN
jgi:hypothetical protein